MANLLVLTFHAGAVKAAAKMLPHCEGQQMWCVALMESIGSKAAGVVHLHMEEYSAAWPVHLPLCRANWRLIVMWQSVRTVSGWRELVRGQGGLADPVVTWHRAKVNGAQPVN